LYLFHVFQNPKVETYRPEDFRSLTDKPKDYSKRFGEETLDESDKNGNNTGIRQRFYLGQVWTFPRYSNIHRDYVVKLNRLHPIDPIDVQLMKGIVQKVRWQVAIPEIPDTITSKSIIGLVLPDDKIEVMTGVMDEQRFRYVFEWLNPYSVACFPLTLPSRRGLGMRKPRK
jgi:hypothetical protein